MGYPFLHAEKEAYILTRTPQPSIGSNHFYKGDVAALVTKLKQKEGNTIFCDGGAQLVNLLLQQGLIDVFHVSIIPVLLGWGIRLFEIFPAQQLKLEHCRTFKSGLVQLRYQK